MDIQQEKIKKYSTIKKLGEGSFGKVYLVQNLKTNVNNNNYYRLYV